ncbi:DHCW motif cupin fold protein [Pseudomonas donghuensis]|uniref:DHCW motif cupin fold protein n=1 Tax=Pseudomonas donghuensis TaxID=1163398 RepID=UPI0009DA5A1C
MPKSIAPVAHAGQTGTAYWRTCQFGSARVRMVEYSPGYLTDHWCWRGHILLCLKGRLNPPPKAVGRQRLLPAKSAPWANDEPSICCIN